MRAFRLLPFRRPARRGLRRLELMSLLGVCVLSFAAGCGDGGEDGPGPSATPTPFSDPASAGWRLLRSATHLDAPRTGRARMYSSASPAPVYPVSNEDYNRYMRPEGRNTFVMAEHQGPGVVTRIWMTARIPGAGSSVPGFDRNAILSVYTDGQPLFSAPLSRFFAGELYPFVPPLVRQHRGNPGGYGFYSYVPISFAASLKVTITDPVPFGGALLTDRHFYQINILDLSGQEPVEASPVRQPDGSLALSPTDAAALQEVRAQWSDPAGFAIAAIEAGRQRVAFAGPVTGTSVVAGLTGPGRIRGLRLDPGAVPPEALDRIRLRIVWDGEAAPSVDLPLGTAWGNHFSRARSATLMQGMGPDGRWYLALPMPFRVSARIELHNTGAPQPIAAEVFWDPGLVRDDARFLHATFAEAVVEAQALLGVVDVAGAGHLVGLRMVVDVRENHNALEGDEFISVDGALTHRGTGTEDFFNAHWFFEGGVRSAALHGVTSIFGRRNQYDVEAGRFLLPDAVPFTTSLRLEVENGNIRGQRDDYRLAAFWYLSR